MLFFMPHQAFAGDEKTAPSVFPVRVVSDAGEVHGTAVLIRLEERANDATLYFLTSSRLFRAADGERQLPAKAVQLRLGEQRTLDVKREDVLVAGAGFVDVAILRAITATTKFFVAKPVIYDPPSVGAVFLVSSPGESGGIRSVAEHVRFESHLLVVGDRDASAVGGCLGAPAISPEGVFGIVRECEPNRSPVISLLAMAQSFIEQYVPRQTTSAAPTPQFSLVERQVAGPLVLVGCSATKTAELNVPLDLGPREFVTDASATLVNPREVRLTDITVLKLEDRSVRLRFTLGGMPASPAPSTDCPQGQALISLHVHLAVTPTP
jgi:hypothetical protein